MFQLRRKFNLLLKKEFTLAENEKGQQSHFTYKSNYYCNTIEKDIIESDLENIIKSNKTMLTCPKDLNHHSEMYDYIYVFSEG